MHKFEISASALELKQSVQEDAVGNVSISLKLSSSPVFIAISPKPHSPQQTQEKIAGIRFFRDKWRALSTGT